MTKARDLQPGDRIIVTVAPDGVLLHTSDYRGVRAWVRVTDESRIGSQTLVFDPDTDLESNPPDQPVTTKERV